MAEIEEALKRPVRISWSSLKLSDHSMSFPAPRRRNFGITRSSNFSPLDAIKSNIDRAKGLWSCFVVGKRIRNFERARSRSTLLCSTSLEVESSRNGGERAKTDIPSSLEGEDAKPASFSSPRNSDFQESSIPAQQKATSRQAKQVERVLISEVLVQNKEGEELDNPELANIALSSLKACKPNSALTVQEVQEDVRRVIESGYFSSCMPVAVDTRDGIRLVFQVEPNQEFRGLICEGANILPTRIVEDAFRSEYGKVVNIQRLDKVLNSINDWYVERGLFAQVSDVEMLSGGIIKLLVSEAEVNNISIRFLDRKTGEPTVGKTRPETLLRQLTTKQGQVYSLQQARRDVDTLLTMGIMEDVSIMPQSAGDTGKVDLTMNVVERVSGGFSAGGGISGSGMTGGLLSGLIGSFAYSHRNVFGRNQKLNISVERGQLDSSFRINYTDPWIEGDDKRTSRSITVQNSRTPGTLIYGPSQSSDPDTRSANPTHVTIGRLIAGVDYSRPLRPRWSGTAGLSFQRAGPLERDSEGQIRISDIYGAPLTFSGKAYDDMLLAKLETIYADSNDRGSSMLVFNMEQGIPILQDWLFFNRVNIRARHGRRIGPAYCIASFSGGKVIGDLAPHEAFAIGGTNSVRGYEEGAVGSGRSSIVASGEMSIPLFGPLEGAIFADYGTDLGSGQTVPGDPAGARHKPGSGYGYGVGVRVESPLGPLRLEYAQNNQRLRRFHFGVGYRN
eukprot:TRINITY_DN10075_c0_g1_i1.p1 TRINITY_DN10075_c0_g1~~TRINITY_DN10075_c0_g1_i1.p1  ORF type:complete len:731 (-),score=127.87 TRINITY_DN10075_c0_g1_i1:281-2473(-)